MELKCIPQTCEMLIEICKKKTITTKYSMIYSIEKNISRWLGIVFGLKII